MPEKRNASKKLRFVIALEFVVFSGFVVGINGAQWIGPTDSSSAIYRSGNVGIGVTGCPLTRLDIKNNSNGGLVRVSGLSSGIQIESQTNEARIVGRNADFTAYKSLALQVSGQGLALYLNGPNNNVGIGTSTPNASYKLQVIGTASADTLVTARLKINNWSLTAPDYVFGKDYHLRSLDSVEAFIKTNNHLPEVPSASAMKEDGVDLAGMNMTLLKKVEELTLYTIELNKAVEQQKAEIEEQKQAIEELGVEK